MVRLSDNSGMIVVYWPDEKAANNFVAAHNDRMRDMMAQNKIRMLEGPLLFSSKRDDE
jgi:hypothetical protein